MDWDRIQGSWKFLKGNVKEQWGRLTDDEVEMVEGSREKLVGKVQQQYGITLDEAGRQVDEWAQRCESGTHGSGGGTKD